MIPAERYKAEWKKIENPLSEFSDLSSNKLSVLNEEHVKDYALTPQTKEFLVNYGLPSYALNSNFAFNIFFKMGLMVTKSYHEIPSKYMNSIVIGHGTKNSRVCIDVKNNDSVILIHHKGFIYEGAEFLNSSVHQLGEYLLAFEQFKVDVDPFEKDKDKLKLQYENLRIQREKLKNKLYKIDEKAIQKNGYWFHILNKKTQNEMLYQNMLSMYKPTYLEIMKKLLNNTFNKIKITAINIL